MIENSFYGLPQGAAFMTRGRNTYHAAPAILKDYGYTSAYSTEMEEVSGTETKYTNLLATIISLMLTYFEIADDDRAEYGLMDKPFFEQSEI